MARRHSCVDGLGAFVRHVTISLVPCRGGGSDEVSSGTDRFSVVYLECILVQPIQKFKYGAIPNVKVVIISRHPGQGGSCKYGNLGSDCGCAERDYKKPNPNFPPMDHTPDTYVVVQGRQKKRVVLDPALYMDLLKKKASKDQGTPTAIDTKKNI